MTSLASATGPEIGGEAAPHLYHVLTECGYRDGPNVMRGAAATIWRSIDRLQAEGGNDAEIRILEQVSVQFHILQDRLWHLERDSAGDLPARARIAELTRQWLGVARFTA